MYKDPIAQKEAQHRSYLRNKSRIRTRAKLWKRKKKYMNTPFERYIHLPKPYKIYLPPIQNILELREMGRHKYAEYVFLLAYKNSKAMRKFKIEENIPVD